MECRHDSKNANFAFKNEKAMKTASSENDTFYQAVKKWCKNAEDYGELPQLCLYVRFNTDTLESTNHARDYVMEGAMVVLIARGSVGLRQNDRLFTMKGPSLMFCEPGATISIGTVEAEEADVHLLYFTRTFLEDLNLSLTALSSEDFITRSRPEIELTEKELSQELRYFKIIRTVMDDPFNYTLNGHIVSALASSLIYQNTVYLFKRQGLEVNDHVPSRRSSYVRDFVRLVHLNYTRERSVLFYAGKLCVSPKYLSILVKESTGRSAAAWIDHFVIMEAKNLLRFSGKNVQQVAYALNFVNQSAFGKYFKHLTGMSPTEYQKKG